ncbi:MAG TPA: ABC transporter substrate-binding protein [Alphaproteobacteria bacterium]|nr:ABC transporter substrate-binding protein [Alphaproteobacteria bacterium]
MTGNNDRRNSGTRRISRRNLLKGAGAGLALAGMLPSIGRSARAAAGKVVVRTGGGAYEDALRKAIFEPFTAETGIEVVSFATNVAKLVAMVEAHDIQVDVADLGEFTTVTFEKRGALEKIDRSKFTRTDLADVSPVEDYYVGENTYATVMGYNKETFASKHPRSWAEFWDVNAFPGSRMLEDMAAEFPNLEFALLADGVAMDKLYPLDVPRAFNKLREIRPNITKWWDSGAVCAQMLANKQVVLGSVWSGRILPLVDANAPVAIEWNQSAVQLQTLCIIKGAPNLENAHKYIDFALQPKPQAEVARLSGYGPVNKKAFALIDAAMATRMPTSPEHAKISFATNARWWVEHKAEVADKWQAFVLGE